MSFKNTGKSFPRCERNLQPKLFAKLKQKKAKNVFWRKSKGSCSSEKERKVNALALRAEEGRDNLRKAAVSWK